MTQTSKPYKMAFLGGTMFRADATESPKVAVTLPEGCIGLLPVFKTEQAAIKGSYGIEPAGQIGLTGDTPEPGDDDG